MKGMYRWWHFAWVGFVVAGFAYGGYEAIERGASSETRSVALWRPWSARVFREDGTVVEPVFLGDRFASVELRERERCRIEIEAPGLSAGEEARVHATHGGEIQGKPRQVLTTEKAGKLVFTYQVGRYGMHPVRVWMRGRQVTLLFYVRPGLRAPRAEGGP